MFQRELITAASISLAIVLGACAGRLKACWCPSHNLLKAHPG